MMPRWAYVPLALTLTLTLALTLALTPTLTLTLILTLTQGVYGPGGAHGIVGKREQSV